MRVIIAEYVSAYRSWPGNVRLIIWTSFLSSIAGGAVGLLLNFYVLAAGLSENDLGTLLSIGPALNASLAIPAGLIADRFSRRRVIQMSGVVGALGMGVIVASSDRAGFFAGQALVSLAETFLGVTLVAYLTDHSSDRSRTHLFTIQLLQYQVVSALATYGAGFLPKLFGMWLGVPQESAEAYRLSLLSALALTGVAAGLLLRLGKDDAPAGAPASTTGECNESLRGSVGGRPLAVGWRSFLSSRPRDLAILVIQGATIGFGAGLFVRFLNVIINRRFGLDVATIGGVYGLQSAFSLGAAFVVPRLSSLGGRVRTATWLQASSLPFLLLLAVSPRADVFIAAMIIRGTLMNVANPVRDAFVLGLFEPRERATVTSIQQMVWAGAWAFSAKLTGFLMSRGDYVSIFWIALGLYAFGIGLFHRHFQPVERNLRTPS